MKEPTSKTLPFSSLPASDQQMLLDLQRQSFDYFLHEVNPHTGLVADKTEPGFPCSIAATGMAITNYIIGVENKYLTRLDATERILKVLRFFYNSPQGRQANATGYKGFYYHFLKMGTGEREWRCELSTMDTALLIAGALSAAAYFTHDNERENEIRELADQLYRRVDWRWALNGNKTICHGWKPSSGFLRSQWDTNYSEAMIMYMLALGSPTHPIPIDAYTNWTDTFHLTTAYGIEYLYAGPLFIHQYSHLWIDFRHIRDAFNKKAGFDYFENSSRATRVHQLYAIDNPNNFNQYGKYCWGLTASDGPGRKTYTIKGRKIKFYNYIARGAPYGPDDGTISPWAVVTCIPFAPGIVVETMRHITEKMDSATQLPYLFDASFNPSFPQKTPQSIAWVSPWKFGINQGPVVIMIENYQTEMIWKLMKQCNYITGGLKAAGFTGGWLDEK